MWRLHLLKGYTLMVGAGLFVLGLVGFSPLPPDPVDPESLLHIATGSLFLGGALLLRDLDHLRSFMGGMGLLLVAGKAIIVGARWFDLGIFHLPMIGGVCLVVGVCTLLVALFVGSGPRSV